MPTFHSNSSAKTIEIAHTLTKNLKLPALIILKGDLGAGKTTFTKGLASGLGLQEKDIKSPTFTLLREHKSQATDFYHFDFYRLETADENILSELNNILSNPKAVVVIEWPERIKNTLKPDLFVELIRTGEDEREIIVS